MKLGGLFSGVGGFELAWTQLGHEVAWMCEWDPKARKVLEARFPGVPIYPDVRDLDPAEVEAVDVLTGGSPCQGFSVAGTRSGLEHSESQLFADYVRIVDGLAERGLKYAIWENVPGVLSIRNDDGERTFAHVVGALAGGSAAVRLDAKRKWNAGLVANGGRAVSWRVLDSRYFGVAQRRRRVFACVAFGDSAADRAGRALLAVGEGVRGDSSSGVKARQAVAGGVATSVAEPSGAMTIRKVRSSEWVEDETGSTLAARDYKDSGDLVVEQPAVLMTMREGKPGGGKGPLLSEEQSLTLATGNGQTLFQPEDGISYDGMNQKLEFGVHRSLRIGRDSSDFIVDPEPWGFSAGNSQHARSMGEEQGIAPPVRAVASGTNQAPTVGPVPQSSDFIVEPTLAPSLTASNDPSRSPQSSEVTQQVAAINSAGYGVRRLTPVECERLQSFPDGWTEPAGSDSARYKAMGNAVTVNVVRWILGRLP
jgi:DNA (cytosine-5)-methyltransferase 1